MKREEFIETFQRCLSKAFLDVDWTFSTDEDEAAKICLDRNGALIFNYVKSSYVIEEVEYVKYGIDERRIDYYVLIGMREGNTLRIGMENNEAYMLLRNGRMEDAILYRARK